jgi:hypothetical protein
MGLVTRVPQVQTAKRNAVQRNKTDGRMAEMGQKRTFRSFRPMSALPPKADIAHAWSKSMADDDKAREQIEETNIRWTRKQQRRQDQFLGKQRFLAIMVLLLLIGAYFFSRSH